jgi:hypothetical protein
MGRTDPSSESRHWPTAILFEFDQTRHPMEFDLKQRKESAKPNPMLAI